MEQTIWEHEQQHLTAISKKIELTIAALKDQLKKQKGEIVSERQYASDEFNDVSGENAIQFSQVLQSMELREMLYLNVSELLEKMEALYKSPYFGRIQIENEKGEKETLYIGLSTFRDLVTDDIEIYDWRAPISSLFYENTLGPAKYQIPDGEFIEVEIEGRRQYKILYDKLLQMYDADIYIGDEVLQGLLNDTAKEKMKSIVATIQSDQNAVIRSSNRDNLIVLGPPGSGKTSVAMQRIAFLLYEYRKTMSARNILLVSPSDLFNDYISNVLPELGEQNVQHTTYYRLFRDMKLKMRAETNYENIERLQNGTLLEQESYAFKGSHQFTEQLLAYIEEIKKAGLPFYNLKIGDVVFVSAKQLQQLFYNKFTGDIDFRLKKMRTLLMQKLEREKAEAAKIRLKELKAVTTYIGSDDELEVQANNEMNKRYGKLASIIDSLGFVNVAKMYLTAITYGNETVTPITELTKRNLKQGVLYYEDLAPLMYLHTVIKRMHTQKEIKHIVIDEIQDYSYLQLLVMKELHPYAHFTLLGDRNQLVHPKEKDSLAIPLAQQFKTVELNKSYRSTNEITTYMSAILQNTATLPLGVAGDLPEVHITKNNVEKIVQLVENSYTEGDSFAILCKDNVTCETLFDLLQQYLPELQLITEQQKVYMKGILIMSGYMAKGFEFTTVVLADANADVYSKPMDAYLLYTVASRATRRLFVVTNGKLPAALAQIDKQLYKTV